MCGDKPWSLADRKTVSVLYPSIGIESRRILNCKNPHILIDTLSTVDFRKIVEEAFIRPRNITFDRHVFLIMKQLRGETVEHLCGKSKELAEKCDFENNKIVVPANVNAVQFANNSWTRYWQSTKNVSRQNNPSTLYYSNCEGIWLPNHREKCIAKAKLATIVDFQIILQKFAENKRMWIQSHEI